MASSRLVKIYPRWYQDISFPFTLEQLEDSQLQNKTMEALLKKYLLSLNAASVTAKALILGSCQATCRDQLSGEASVW